MSRRYRIPGDKINTRAQEAIEEGLRISYLRRVLLLALAAMAGLATLFGRMFYLQVKRHDYYRTRAQSNRVRIKAIVPERGIIYDAKGRVLTENIARYQVVANPSQISDLEALMDNFGQIIPFSALERAEFVKQFQTTRRYESAVLKSSISEQDYYRLAVRLYELPGIEIKRYYERYYPYGTLTAHLLGYTNRINKEDLATLDMENYRGLQYIGRSGVERQYEDQLRGQPGYQQVETDANGNLVRLLAEKPAQRGQDIYLSIDVALQKYIADSMGDYRGSCVAINPQDGQVLALVSLPGYDANLFTNGISHRQYQRLLADPRSPLYDRALKGRYPPGSVIKPLISLAGYYHGVFSTQTQVSCSGHYNIPESTSKRRFHCWKRHGHGSMDGNHAMAESCDVYYYTLGYQIGIDRLSDYARHFSIGEQTGIDLPDEASGIMPTRQWKQARYDTPWFIGDTINVSIGQGFLTTTPLQLAYMTALIARDGVAFTPRVLKQVYDPVAERFVFAKAASAKGRLSVYRAADWQAVRMAMENVIHSSYGTGRKLANHISYRMAGKSGTVQVISFQDNERIDSKDLAEEHQDNAMFIAYAPTDKPQIAISMVIERGGGGSSTAGPLVRKISDYYLLGAEHELEQSA